jgi:UDP-N-acetyl-D-mannosaminuronate dehydrogenase
MPEAVVARIEKVVGPLSGLDIAVLGAAYRGGVKETAFSGVFATATALESRGATVKVHDPLYSDLELCGLGFQPFHRGEAADVAIIQADHDEYRDWNYLDVPRLRLVMDGRGISSSDNWGEDVLYLKIGQPTPNLEI